MSGDGRIVRARAEAQSVACPNDCSGGWVPGESACGDPDHCINAKSCPACGGAGRVTVQRFKNWESKHGRA